MRAAGTSLDKAVSATVILADEDDFAGMNEEWVTWFPKDPPPLAAAHRRVGFFAAVFVFPGFSRDWTLVMSGR